MTLKASARSFLERAKTFLTDIFSKSDTASFWMPFLSGYYAYMGIAMTILTGSPVLFVTLALPAIVGIVCIIVEACTKPKWELQDADCSFAE
jgi:hypothetical protein